MSGTFVRISTFGTILRERTEKMGSAPYAPLRDLVGGYMERIQVKWEGRLRQAYVDEDGISKGLARNPHADSLLTPLWQGAQIYGPLVIWIPDSRPYTKKPKV